MNSIYSFGSAALRLFMILAPMRSDWRECARMQTLELKALWDIKLFDNIIYYLIIIITSINIL